jgi:hypothetical protein
VIHEALHRSIPVELTADRRITRRVKRLAATSAVALGLIWVLAVTTLEAPAPVDAALAAGWIMMPAVLVASLWRPFIRYWLIVPSTLVGLGLVAISLGWLPENPAAAAGWLSMTVGVLLGGVLGLWFWFRVVPVPATLDDPFSVGRWALIGLHVALITTGLALASTALVATLALTGLS